MAENCKGKEIQFRSNSSHCAALEILNPDKRVFDPGFASPVTSRVNTDRQLTSSYDAKEHNQQRNERTIN